MNSYPLSSCPNQECGPSSMYSIVPESKNAMPCLLGVSNCNVPLPLQYCTSKQAYRQTIEPPFEGYTNGNVPINKIGPVIDKKWYVPVKSDLSSQCKTSYAGFNPILYDSMRAQRMLLDRPHYTGEVAVGNVCKDEIYTPYFRNYGKNYTSYSDINAGDIQYWKSDSAKDAYVEPVFVTPAIVDHIININPMGVVYPEYKRQSLKQYDWDKCNQDSCDSFTHDTLEFRQELIEAQSRKRNQQDYLYRWGRN